MRRESLRPLLPLYNKCKGSNRSRIFLGLAATVFFFLLLSATCRITEEDLDLSYLVPLSDDSRLLEYLRFSNHTIHVPPVADAADDLTLPPATTCEDVHTLADDLSDIVWYLPDELSADYELQGWEDDWLSDGIIKPHDGLQSPKIDIVYTYVESNEAFMAMKAVYDEKNEPSKKPGWATLQARRYRSWNELRYSIRGAVQHGKEWLSKIHIVAKDFEVFDPETNETSRILQVPSWLNTSRVAQEDSQLAIVPESSILNTTLCAPTFNSMSIEASLANVPLTGDHFIGMSDDMMFGQNISSSDFISPLFGMSVSPYLDIWRVDEDSEPNLSNGEQGEGHAVRYTSYLLNQRFGKRPRHLQIHQAKIVNRVILKEALMTFPRAALLTPLSRYRDDSQQLYAWYLHMHFTAEMHREALLWSLALKIDSDEDGLISAEEHASFLEDLASGASREGEREASPMLPLIHDRLHSAGLAPLAIQKPIWTSMDGPMYLRDLDRAKCKEDDEMMKECLNFSNISTPLDFFNAITAKQVVCGDCLLSRMLNVAQVGLSPLLPKRGGRYREGALAAIQKYAYMQTMPENVFTMVRNIPDAKGLPNLLNHMPGLLCINDDVMTQDQGTLDRIAESYNQLFNGAYPIPSSFEVEL